MLNDSPNNKQNLVEECKVLLESASKVLLGKESQVEKALVCILSGGHLLLEDVPGVGKTTLAKILARVCGFEVTRIQFTNDLLPADITGSAIFNTTTNEFEFRSGPIFGHFVLADELNRATPKTQSALLQAMEERHITVDGQTFELKEPFVVLPPRIRSSKSEHFHFPSLKLIVSRWVLSSNSQRENLKKKFLSKETPPK